MPPWERGPRNTTDIVDMRSCVRQKAVSMCIQVVSSVAYLLPYGIQPCLGVEPLLCYCHDAVAANSFSAPLHPFSAAPFLSAWPLPSVLAPLHSVSSSFSPHLPVFCALSTLPPALPVLVQPRPLFPLCLPFPLWCCPLTPHPVLPPSLLLTGTPNLLVLLLTAPP